MSPHITIAVADDNYIFREGLCRTICNFGNFDIVLKEDDCEEMLIKIGVLQRPPDICIIDMAMPGGYQVLKQMKELYPIIKVLILSMLDNELNIIRTIKVGANGFLMKGCSLADMKQALVAIYENGYYYPEMVAIDKNAPRDSLLIQLSYAELEMLSLSCTEMHMGQIAARMNMSLKAADRCREELFNKLNVKTRVGLVLFALNIGMIPASA